MGPDFVSNTQTSEVFGYGGTVCLKLRISNMPGTWRMQESANNVGERVVWHEDEQGKMHFPICLRCE